MRVVASVPVVTVAVIRVRAYEVIERAVSEGTAAGVRRAYKYTDTPSQDAIADECGRAVMAALEEVLDYGEAP